MEKTGPKVSACKLIQRDTQAGVFQMGRVFVNSMVFPSSSLMIDSVLPGSLQEVISRLVMFFGIMFCSVWQIRLGRRILQGGLAGSGHAKSCYARLSGLLYLLTTAPELQLLLGQNITCWHLYFPVSLKVSST